MSHDGERAESSIEFWGFIYDLSMVIFAFSPYLSVALNVAQLNRECGEGAIAWIALNNCKFSQYNYKQSLLLILEKRKNPINTARRRGCLLDANNNDDDGPRSNIWNEGV